MFAYRSLCKLKLQRNAAFLVDAENSVCDRTKALLIWSQLVAGISKNLGDRQVLFQHLVPNQGLEDHLRCLLTWYYGQVPFHYGFLCHDFHGNGHWISECYLYFRSFDSDRNWPLVQELWDRSIWKVSNWK